MYSTYTTFSVTFRGGGGGWRYSGNRKVSCRKVLADTQSLTFLHTIFDRKVTPFMYLPWKMIPLSHTLFKTFYLKYCKRVFWKLG